MDQEQLEFAIARYAEGDLPADEARALELVLESDPAARALLADERALTALLRATPGPEVVWSELAGDLSAVVTGTVDPAARAHDQKLNALLRGLGPVPGLRWDALAAHISGALDAALDSAAADDDQLTLALRGSPLPDMKWDALAGQISAHIDAAEGEAEVRLDAMLQSALAPEVDWTQLSQQIQDKIDVAEAHADERLDAMLRSGPLPAVNWGALSQHISAEIDHAEARADQQLDEVLKSVTVPAINYAALAGQISASVADAADEQDAAERQQRERLRIGSGSRWVRNITRVAVAAVVAVAAAVGIRMYSGQEQHPDVGLRTGPAPVVVATIQGPQVEEATAPAVVDVQIGPAASYAARTGDEYVGFGNREPIVFATPIRVAEDSAPGIFE